ncbi:MAG: hypothetical protein ACOZF0_20985 [Thermodesulfobacteriota bacterium]
MHTIIQENKENKGRVQAHVDSFILTETAAPVKYLSLFGTTGAVKSLAAQIIANRDSIHLMDETGRFILQEGCKPLELKRGGDSMRTYTRNVKPGVTHKILYSPDCFVPWKKTGACEFITFGPTDEEARKRAFHIVDRLTNVPLKDAWIDWLWETLTLDSMLPMPVVGGDVPEFANCRMIPIPNDDWLEARIREDLDILQAA